MALVVAGTVDEKGRAHADALRARGQEIGGLEFRTGNTDAPMRRLYDRRAAVPLRRGSGDDAV